MGKKMNTLCRCPEGKKRFGGQEVLDQIVFLLLAQVILLTWNICMFLSRTVQQEELGRKPNDFTMDC